jgi:uncharacterized protein YjbI with pentapeptide repeats
MDFSQETGKKSRQPIGIDKYIIGIDETNIPAKYFQNSRETLRFVNFTSHSLKIIGKHAFEKCICLANVDLSGARELETIEKYAFFCCSKLESVVFNEKLAVIEESAFSHCISLTSLLFPPNSKLSFVGMLAFDSTGLTAIDFPYTVSCFEGSIGSSNVTNVTFNGTLQGQNYYLNELTGCVFSNTNLDAAYLIRSTTAETYEIPQGTCTILSWCFAYSEINKIVIPTSVVYINERAFYNSLLTEIVFTDGSLVRLIGVSCFESCKNLRRIDLAGLSDYDKIDAEVFHKCTKLEHATISGNVLIIGCRAFCDCTDLTNFTIIGRQCLLKINYGCFRNTGLYYFKLPVSLVVLHSEAFAFCPNLVLDIDENNVNYKMINSCLYSIDCKIIIYYPCNHKNESFTIPQSVTCIRSNCFVGACNLHELILPPNLQTIMAFGISFTSIKKLILPDTVMSLMESCFASNSKLEYIELRGNIKSIPMHCLFNCTALKYINIYANITSIKASALDKCYSLICIYAPKSLFQALRRTVPYRVLSSDNCKCISDYITVI